MATPEPLAILPDKQGACGRAWRCDLVALREALDVPVDRFVAVDRWIVEAPWAHPCWHSYALTLVHLRSAPGLPEPTIFRPGATHELILFALDPQVARLHALRSQNPAILHPVNFAAQLVEPDDAAAIARVEQAVIAIVAGDLSPDTDFRSQWVALFGDHMMREQA